MFRRHNAIAKVSTENRTELFAAVVISERIDRGHSGEPDVVQMVATLFSINPLV